MFVIGKEIKQTNRYKPKGGNHPKSHYLDITIINILMYTFQRYDYMATTPFFIKSTFNNPLIFTLNPVLHLGSVILVFL